MPLLGNAAINRICRLDGLSEQVVRDARFVNEGVLAEHFVAQQLYFLDSPKRQPDLHYWLREGRANNAEVDPTTLTRAREHHRYAIPLDPPPSTLNTFTLTKFELPPFLSPHLSTK